MTIAHFIDHTILKQTTGIKDISKVCEEAREYGFAAVCIPPIYVQKAAELLNGTEVKVATVVGFPFGYHAIDTKITEAKQAINDGTDELDMVMNVAAVKNKDYGYLENEISALLEISKKNEVLVKVIIESGILNEEEIIRCCELYRNFDVDFLKTSTGFAEKGASVEAVKLMRENLPAHIQIKASGGIKTFDFAKELIEAGATRLGCSASVAIVKDETGDSGY
jgi:deoxyribose-phosphate aldolase